MIDVLNLLEWSEPVNRQTRGNMRSVRSASPTPEFWETWKDNKQELKNAGISVWRDEQTGTWQVDLWSDPVQKEAAKTSTVHVPDAIAKLLRPYQVPLVADAVACFNRGDRGYLNASGMGSGKTYVACAVARMMNLRPIIVCRKAAFSNWKHVTLSHFGFPPAQVTIINPEMLRTGRTPLGAWKIPAGKRKEVFYWQIPKDSLVIWDEVHNCGGDDTRNSAVIVSAYDQGHRILALSATGANSPLKMKALGYILGLHQYEDFYAFCYSHGCQEGTYGLKFTAGVHWRTAKDEPEVLEEAQDRIMHRIHEKIFKKGRGVRLSTKDIPGFPETQIIPTGIEFDETDRMNMVYQRMLDELEHSPDQSPMARRAIMTRARAEVELLKVPEIINEVKNALEEGMSIAVFVSFVRTAEELAKRLKTDCKIVGGQTQKERDQAIEDFQRDRERVIICNIQAGGESVSLHDTRGRHPRLSIISPSFWAESVIQSLGRVNRDGGMSKSIQKIIFALGTIEEDAYNNFLSKQRRIAAFNGDFIPTDGDLQSMKLAA
jgi:superfamily II DNA or RNA helicase